LASAGPRAATTKGEEASTKSGTRSFWETDEFHQ
jgi:hypothetical protein